MPYNLAATYTTLAFQDEYTTSFTAQIIGSNLNTNTQK